MPQMHFYVAEEIADEVKRRADEEGVTVSRYLADLVRREVADEWPPGFFEEVVGGWVGEPLERPPDLPWAEREPFDVLGPTAEPVDPVAGSASVDGPAGISPGDDSGMGSRPGPEDP